MAKFTPLDSRRKSEDVAEQIREMAFSRKLRTGERLPPERVLAQQFNVSRAGLREALRLLESQGFLVIKRGRQGGAYVQEMHSRPVVGAFGHMLRLGHVSIAQLLDARLGIEITMLEFVNKNGRAEWVRRLEANVAEAERLRAVSPRDSEKRVELLGNLHEFHRLLAGATNNPVFMLAADTIIAIISTHLDEIGHRGCVSLDSVAEHRAVLQAIKTGRLHDARDVLEAHLKADNRRTFALLRRYERRPRRSPRRGKRPLAAKRPRPSST
ncbi:MAG: FadR family transcriptional regulator [Acidobacteria bacterium]|nr:FadR family transcriptional regulator [Acidobacteriota bacterium]